MTKRQMKLLYQNYIDNFDPTPDYSGDDYKTPMSFDEFSEEFLFLYDEWNS